jgi:hypothetical protein
MRLGVLLVNLENVGEGSKMLDAEATAAQMDQQAKPAFPVEDFESGKIAINPGWESLGQVAGRRVHRGITFGITGVRGQRDQKLRAGKVRL